MIVSLLAVIRLKFCPVTFEHLVKVVEGLKRRERQTDKMRECAEGNVAEMFIISALSMIPQIKIPKDGITTDKHVIMLFHAYLPSTCMCLASVFRLLFLPGSDSQTNNEGQTEFYVSTPNVSRNKFQPLSTELQALGSGALADAQCGAHCICSVCFPHMMWRRLSSVK